MLQLAHVQNMNRKENIGTAILATAILATILTATTPSALALGHWNDGDEDYVPTGSFANGGMASPDFENTDADNESNDEDTEATDDGENSADTNNSDEDLPDELQACLSDVEGDGSSTEQEALDDCIDSAYSELNTDEDNEDESGVTEDDDAEDNEEDEGDSEE